MNEALKSLQERFPELLAALEASPAMKPFAWDLRVLVDPRTKTERIDAAINEHVGALTNISTRAQTGSLRGRLISKLTVTSLDAVPCDRVIRERLTVLHEKKRNFAPESPFQDASLTYASTIAST